MGSISKGIELLIQISSHGTGTPVGDPIEVAAVQRAMGSTRHIASPILIGSVRGLLILHDFYGT